MPKVTSFLKTKHQKALQEVHQETLEFAIKLADHIGVTLSTFDHYIKAENTHEYLFIVHDIMEFKAEVSNLTWESLAIFLRSQKLFNLNINLDITTGKVVLRIYCDTMITMLSPISKKNIVSFLDECYEQVVSPFISTQIIPELEDVPENPEGVLLYLCPNTDKFLKGN
jgi:hypothetical protein